MKTTLAAAAVTGVLLMASGCGGGSSADADPDKPISADVVVTGTTEPIVIPWLVGQDQGFFEERGVKLENVISGKSGSTALRTQLAGDVAIGDMSYGAVMEAQATGTPIIAVGGGTQAAGFFPFYALANNDSVNEIRDAKVWGFSNPNTTTEALTHILPEKAGVDPESVERVAAGGLGEGIALLESGKVDVTMIPDSLIWKNKDDFKFIASDADFFDATQITLLTTTKEYAEAHPKAIEALVAGYEESYQWIEANPEDAARLYAEFNDIPEDVAVEIVRNSIELDAWGVGFNQPAIETGTEILRGAGYDGDINYCETFDDRYLPDGASTALPEACD